MTYVYATIAFAVLTIAGIISMAIDKAKAKRGEWRIPEKALFLIAFFGGGVGSLAGMYAFRHKTKHKKFVVGMPLCAVISVILIYGTAYLINAII